MQGFRMIDGAWILAGLSILLILVLRDNRFARLRWFLSSAACF
jgi:hypothetical protein